MLQDLRTLLSVRFAKSGFRLGYLTHRGQNYGGTQRNPISDILPTFQIRFKVKSELAAFQGLGFCRLIQKKGLPPLHPNQYTRQEGVHNPLTIQYGRWRFTCWHFLVKVGLPASLAQAIPKPGSLNPHSRAQTPHTKPLNPKPLNPTAHSRVHVEVVQGGVRAASLALHKHRASLRPGTATKTIDWV